MVYFRFYLLHLGIGESNVEHFSMAASTPKYHEKKLKHLYSVLLFFFVTIQLCDVITTELQLSPTKEIGL